jgi:hypothetical protein
VVLPSGVGLRQVIRGIWFLRAASPPLACRGGEGRETICYPSDSPKVAGLGAQMLLLDYRGVISMALPSTTSAEGQPTLIFGSSSLTALQRKVIRIKGMILEFCPELSQRVKPIDKSSNHAKNATQRRGMNPASNVKRINTPQT